MSCGHSPRFRAMTGTEPKTTLREFSEYFASSYEALAKLAARIGVPPNSRRCAGQQQAERIRLASTSNARQSAGFG